MRTHHGDEGPALFALVGSEPSHRDRVRSGMVWAAWADALGFITELTDERGVQRRTGGHDLTHPIAWHRRVGGRQGPRVALPAGCYSDDTQLRLGTARAISRSGFDVEAFAKIELGVWPSYALGGGRASKAAASRISRTTASWFSNQFDGWHQAGGNGAAMRVQPHVWAAGRERDALPDVIRDAVTTHGHPRALVGAVLLAAAVRHAAVKGRAPSVADWPQLLTVTKNAFDVFNYDGHLGGYWRPQWERTARADLAEQWSHTLDECDALLRQAQPFVERMGASPESRAVPAYAELAQKLGLYDPQVRGSGTVTVVAALALAAAFGDDPYRASLVPALAVGTDTDTIATMAASIVATANPHVLPSPVQDEEYLLKQADRLAALAAGEHIDPYGYPDLLHWVGPRAALDCVGLVDGQPALAGLGMLTPIESSASTREASWMWVRADSGQTFLVKHRHQLEELPSPNRPRRRASSEQGRESGPAAVRNEGSTALTTHAEVEMTGSADLARPVEQADTSPQNAHVDVDSMLGWVQRQRFTPEAIGYAVKRVSEVGSVEQLVAFAVGLRNALVHPQS